MTQEERIAALEARVALLEKMVVCMAEHDKEVREAELALANGGAI